MPGFLEYLSRVFRGDRRDGPSTLGEAAPISDRSLVEMTRLRQMELQVGTSAGDPGLDAVTLPHLLERSMRHAMYHPGDTHNHNHNGDISCDTSCPAYRRPPSTFRMEGDIHVGASRGALPHGVWAIDEIVPGRSEYTLSLQGDSVDAFALQSLGLYPPEERSTPHSLSPPRFLEDIPPAGEWRRTAQQLYEGGVISAVTYDRLMRAVYHPEDRTPGEWEMMQRLAGQDAKPFGENTLGTFPRKKEE